MSSSTQAFLRIRVIPRSSRAGLSRDAQGALRAHLNAPPVDGAANRALLALLADLLKVPRSALEIARGERGRDKLVRVRDRTESEIVKRLECVLSPPVDKAEPRG